MKYGYYEWEKREDGTVRIVKYVGDDTEAVVPEAIENLPVTEIGPRAFFRCDRLAEIVLPNGLKRIGSFAFSGCYGLTQVKLPASLERIEDGAFAGCFDLRKIESPLRMEPVSFGADVFDSCFRLDYAAVSAQLGRLPRLSGPERRSRAQMVELFGSYRRACRGERRPPRPQKLEKLRCGPYEYTRHTGPGGDYAEITNHFGLVKELTIPTELNGVPVKRLGDWAFQGLENPVRVIIPEGVTAVGMATFELSDLREVWIPNSLTSMSGNPFAGCHDLRFHISPDHPCLGVMDGCALYDKREMRLIAYSGSPERTAYRVREGIRNIGDNAFDEAVHLRSVELPSTLTGIGYRAFHGCRSLEHMEIPEGVTFIGSGVCEDCERLESVRIPDSATYIGKSAFDGAKALRRVQLPKGIDAIEDYTFRGCSALRGVTLPEGVTRIGEAAFAGCESLEAVECPNSLLQVGEGAFNSCISLKDVALNDGLFSIGSRAFQYDARLSTLEVPASVTDIGYAAFADCEALTLCARRRSAAEKYAREYGIPFKPLSALPLPRLRETRP